MKLRQLMIGMLLLCVAGCGCNDDTSPPGVTSPPITVVLNAGTTAPPLQVQPNPGVPPVVPIDIFFLLDDGRDMAGLAVPGSLGVLLGIIPQNPDDDRERSFAAQRIFAKLQAMVEQKLRARIEDEFNNDPTQFPPDFDVDAYIEQLDFAFGVGRYEDFGGDFWKAPSATLLNRRARPFILNMPLLRTKIPGFDTLFAAALAREAPGDGNPIDNSSGVPVRVSDPQSGIEALYQVAAGPNTQFPSGFDGDASGDTLGSGQPCSLAEGLNPQTAPGTTGDVPAVQYSDPLPDPQDPNRNIYTVLDEQGNTVMNGDVPCQTSGNIGGVGWREGAARFVILAGDIATVSPTRNPQPAEPTENVENTDGAPDAPRDSTFIPMPGFDGNAGRHGLAGPGISPGVSGLPGELGVAPEGAHTVEDAIEALNALDIEVINLAAPDVISNDTKPTVPGDSNVNGDFESDIDDVIKYFPTITPWTWMTGVSRLTGAVSPTKTSTQAPVNLALVYNLATVWPYVSDAEQFNEANIKPDVEDDLVERLMEWVKGGFLLPAGGSSAPEKPDLPRVFYDFELVILDDQAEEEELPPDFSSDLTRTSPPGTSFLVTDVEIPVYYAGDAAPTPAGVIFPADGTITYDTVNETIPLPAIDTFGFYITARLNRIEGQTSENQQQVDEIIAYIKARGDGFTFDSQGCIEELGSEFQTIIQAEGTLQVTVRTTDNPGTTANLSSIDRGCAVVVDLAPGADPTPQVGGTCPFPGDPPPCAK
jgi:hypothetical protein